MCIDSGAMWAVSGAVWATATNVWTILSSVWDILYHFSWAVVLGSKWYLGVVTTYVWDFSVTVGTVTGTL